MKKNLLSVTLAILFIASTVFFTGCGKKEAIGYEDEIIVVADSAEYYELEPVMLQIFEKTIITPREEKLFKLSWKPFSQINEFVNRKNIIIVAPLDTESSASKFVTSVLDSTVLDLVKKNEEFVFNKYDLWARNQLTMIITGNTIEDINKNILTKHEDLLYYFQKVSDKRLSSKLHGSIYENREKEAELLKQHGWKIFVQVDFLQAKNDTVNNFVWLRRQPKTILERWVFVHWIENASPEYLNKDSVRVLRDRLTKKYYVTTDDKYHVEIVSMGDFYKTEEVNFNGKYALFTQGLWGMTDKSMGGPFINYTFYDEKTKRLYMLDGSVFAPKNEKKGMIQQLDVMLRSFRAEHEMTPEEVEDLLDEID